MKVLAIVFAIMLFAFPAAAQYGGSIALFADEGMTECNLFDLFGIQYIYVFHLYSPGVTGSQFRIDLSPGINMISLGYFVPVPIIDVGDPFTGISLGYGGCSSTPLLIMRLDFFSQGLSTSCGYMRVVGHPNATPPGLYAADCAYALLYASGGEFVVNPNASCDCDIPAEETNWGQIKSLYQ